MLDHSHCERKAAGVALNLRFRYSEARHYGTYWILADRYFERSQVTQRLEELAIVESQLLATLHPEPRIHS